MNSFRINISCLGGKLKSKYKADIDEAIVPSGLVLVVF